VERPQAVRTRIRRRVPALGSLAGVLLLLGAAVAAPAQAAPGDLDPTFSGDGKQSTDFGFGSGTAAATVRQPDGKIVAVGSTFGSIALARYNPNGSLDTSFSGDGRQITEFDPGAFVQANGVALQADGKIVVAGRTADDFALARYNLNGSLDTSFSGDGKQTTDFGSPEAGTADQAHAVAIQSDGKIVAVGSTGSLSSSNFALARYNTNGSLDTSFSGDGKQITGFGAGTNDQANGVALQADGKIVAAGTTGFGSSGDFALARYNPNGSLDATFSGDGKQTTDFGGFDQANGIALQADGKIVAVGGNGANIDFALARYNSNGTLDTTLSGDGKQTTDFGNFDRANAVTLLPGNKPLAVGQSGNDFALARYNANGSLDTAFSGDGMQTTSFPGFDEAKGLALQADGKIVAAGGTGDDEGSGAVDFALARYNASGSLDTTFSGDGRQTTDFGQFEEVSGVALQSDGKIVAVGRTGGCQCSTSPMPDDFALARYNTNGLLDTTFSGDGKQTTTFRPHGTDDFDVPTAVALQGDGKIVVAGYSFNGSDYDFALARYNPNGSLDTSFSGDGRQTTDFAAADDRAAGMVLQANGKVVVAGRAGDDFALARYNSNGSLDTTFSGDGKQTTDFGAFDGANAVGLQADGRIVAAGFTGVGNNFALARYTANGSLDTTFSGDGKQVTDFGGFDAANAVAIKSTGRIIAAGGGDASGGHIDFALARYNPNGSLDTSFSGDGKQTTDFGGEGEHANAVALQGDGNIVAAGNALGADGTRDFALARYLGG
jgi:uncharacterized delta-60 repeat protein